MGKKNVTTKAMPVSKETFVIQHLPTMQDIEEAEEQQKMLVSVQFAPEGLQTERDYYMVWQGFKTGRDIRDSSHHLFRLIDEPFKATLTQDKVAEMMIESIIDASAKDPMILSKLVSGASVKGEGDESKGTD